jgi:hypothetical protein
MKSPKLQDEPAQHRVWDREAVRMSVSLFAVLVGLLLLPLFAHGCHGDDLDLEPAAPPAETRPE